MKKCIICKKEHDGLYGSGRFCSKKCASIFSTKKDNIKESKLAICMSCGKEIKVNKRSDPLRVKCFECKKIKKNTKTKICKICGSISNQCKKPDICKRKGVFPTLIKYFGLDINKMGSIIIYEEFERIKTILIEEYWENNKSLSEIAKRYALNNHMTLINIFKMFQINRRNLKEAQINCVLNGNLNHNNSIKSQQYKHGWHTTWNNKQVYYRSSYELDYCIELDNKQVDYEMEFLRILYWDSQLLRQRVAIPDFYIPSENKIIEIKSDWTYDEQNMKDKIKAYKQHGYNFDVILEHSIINISS